MTRPVVLEAVEHALWVREREAYPIVKGLIYHTDAGLQYVSFAMMTRLAQAGIEYSPQCQKMPNFASCHHWGTPGLG